MINRKDVRVDDEYSIAVVTERMADGGWAVVASPPLITTGAVALRVPALTSIVAGGDSVVNVASAPLVSAP